MQNKLIQKILNAIPFYLFIKLKIKERKSDGNSYLTDLGLPEKIQPPVDVEKAGQSTHIFFNLDKYMRYKKWTSFYRHWPDRISVAIYNFTFDNLLFARYADHLNNKITEYNQLKPKEQFDYKIKKTLISSIIKTVIITALSFYIFLIFLPNFNLSNGQKLINNGEYAEAISVLSGQDSTESKQLVYYAQMMYHLTEDYDFDEGIKMAKKLEDVYINNYVNTKNLVKQAYYIKGNYYYEKKNYIEATRAFKYSGDYENSKELYAISAYNSYDELVELELFAEAISNLVPISSYKDSTDRLHILFTKLYDQATLDYNDKRYTLAANEFKDLAVYNYKNANTMMKQSTYKNALELFEKKDYDNALILFEKNKNYKDSRTMIKNINYIQGLSYLDNDGAKAFQSFIKSYNFKDSNDYLKYPNIVLYGSWSVTQENGITVDESVFKFYLSGNTSAKGLKLIEDLYVYDYEKNLFTSDNSTIKVSIKDVDNITIEITSDKEQVSYSLQRTESLIDTASKESDGIKNAIEILFNKGGN